MISRSIVSLSTVQSEKDLPVQKRVQSLKKAKFPVKFLPLFFMRSMTALWSVTQYKLSAALIGSFHLLLPLFTVG